MDLSGRDAFRPSLRTHQATKSNFVLLVKENCDWSKPPILFLSYVSQCNIVTSKFFPTTTDHRYPALTVCSKPSFTISKTLLLKSTIDHRNLQARPTQGLREKISQGVQRSIPGPQILLGPPSLIRAHAVKSLFVGWV